MINLDVADYCHNCDGFDPVAYKTDISTPNNPNTVMTVVRCDNNRKCLAMYRHIQKEVEKNHVE